MDHTQTSFGGTNTNGSPMMKNKMRVIEEFAERRALEWNQIDGSHKVYHIFDRDGDANIEAPDYANHMRIAALIVQILVTMLLVIAVLVGSLREQRFDNPSQPWQKLKIFCVSYFAFDWFLRLFTCPAGLWTFLFRFWNIFDIAVLVPPIITFSGTSQANYAVADVFLMLRLAFMIRAVMSVHDFSVVTSTVRNSSEIIVVLLMCAVILLPMGGIAMHYAERGEFDPTTKMWRRECFTPDPCTTEWSPFQDAFEGMWFVFNAMTTLGFGDLTPTSRAGKLIGAACMIFGVFFLIYGIMILAVNYDEEQRRNESGRSLKEALSGESLRDMQRKYTKLISDGKQNFVRPLPVFFYPREDLVPRQLVLYRYQDPDGRPDEARYTPLFYLARNPKTNALLMTEKRKSTLRVSLQLCLDTLPAQDLAKETINAYSSDQMPFHVELARFFPVLRMFLRLELPDSHRALLEDIRLIDQVIEITDHDEMVIPVTLEILDRTRGVDEIRADFLEVLHRCRLNITSWVVQEEPMFFEVPVFCGVVCATSLVREMLGQKSGVVYVTEDQIYTLLNGVHNLLDLSQKPKDPNNNNNKKPKKEKKAAAQIVDRDAFGDIEAVEETGYEYDDDDEDEFGTGAGELTVILNTKDVQKQICDAIIDKVCAPCEDPSSLRDDAFLFGRPNDDSLITYHGVFVRRLTRDVRMVLCDVQVLAVRPKTHMVSLLL